MSEILSNLALPVLVALAVAARGFRVDEDYVARWASSAGVELTPVSRPVVRRYLAWSRRSRTTGGLAGFLAPLIHERITAGTTDSGGLSFVLMLAGYLFGALLAEIVIGRPGRRTRTALLVPRRLNDYLPGYVLVLQRGLGTLSPLLAIGYFLLEPLARRSVPDPAAVAALGVAGVCIAATIEALQRTIVSRGRPVGGTSDSAVDDAMRSSSVHVLAGAGVALLLNIVGVLLAALAILAGGTGGVVGLVVFLTLFVSSIAFWLDLGKPDGFRVRRSQIQGAMPTQHLQEGKERP